MITHDNIDLYVLNRRPTPYGYVRYFPKYGELMTIEFLEKELIIGRTRYKYSTLSFKKLVNKHRGLGKRQLNTFMYYDPIVQLIISNESSEQSIYIWHVKNPKATVDFRNKLDSILRGTPVEEVPNFPDVKARAPLFFLFLFFMTLAIAFTIVFGVNIGTVVNIKDFLFNVLFFAILVYPGKYTLDYYRKQGKDQILAQQWLEEYWFSKS